jgi:head-tail adaptor
MSFRLDRLMVLEAASRVADGAGGYSQSWSERGMLWAAVRPGSGRADEVGLVAQSLLPLRIVVRAAPVGHSARPAPGQRLVEGDRRYRILAVAEADAAGRFLTCFAREETAT